MLFKKINYISTAILVFLSILFAVLKKYVWSGFSYFVLTLLTFLMLIWAAYFIFEYFTDYKKELAEQYSFYRAKKVNKTNIEIDENEEYVLKKEFNKSTVKQKLVKWCIIFVFIAIAVALVVAMFFVS